MRRAVAIAAAVLIGLLGLAGAAVWVLTRAEFADAVRGRLVREASLALRRDVVVTRLSGDPIRGIVLEGVRIPNRGSPGTFFEAPRVVVRFDPRRLAADLWGGRGVAASIITVELDHPVLVLSRDMSGRWNYADLLVPGEPQQELAAAFRAGVEVREGSLVFTDALHFVTAPFAARFERVTGRLDFSGAPLMRGMLDAVNVDGTTPATVRVTGTARLAAGTFDLDLQIAGGAVGHWGRYLVRLPRVGWLGGTFDGAAYLLASPWRGAVALDYRAALTFRDATAILLPQQTVLAAINGPLQVDNFVVTSPGMTMDVGGSPVWVRGDIVYSPALDLDLVVRSTRLDLRTLQRLVFPQSRIRLAGIARGEARVTGALDSPVVEGMIVRAAGSVDRQGFTDLSSDFSLAGGWLTFANLRASSGGGRVEGQARLDVQNGDFFLVAHARDVDTRALPGMGITIDPTLRGPATGVVLSSRTAGTVSAQARVQIGAGGILGISFDRLAAGFWYDRGRLELDYLAARSGPNSVHASGVMDQSGHLAFALTASQINLRTVGERFGLQRWLAGTAEIWGTIAGTRRAPVLLADVDARAGALGPFPFDAARGSIRLTSTGLSSPRLSLVDGQGTYIAAGSINWSRRRLDLAVAAERVPAQRLLEIARAPLSLVGTVSASVRLTGDLANPQASGTVDLTEGRVEGQPVDRARGTFRWTGDQLLIDEAVAQVGTSVLQGVGSVTRAGRINLGFAAKNFELRDIGILRSDFVRVSGTVDLTGSIGGTVRAPTVAAALSSTSLTVNGQSFDRATGSARYAAGRLSLRPLFLEQGDGRYRFSGDVTFGTAPTVSIEAAAERGELATLLGLAGIRPPFALRGTVDGSFAVTGRIANPSARLDFHLRDGRVGDHVIREAAVDATLANRAIALRTLTVRPQRGELIGAGTVNLGGGSDVEFAGRGLDLDLLRPLLRIDRPLAGTLDFTVQLSGPINDPQAGVSASVSDGAIGAAAFDRLLLQAFYDRGQFQIEQGLLQEGPHKARFGGSLPFNPARLRFDEDRPMDLQVALDGGDLSVIGLFTDVLERASGPLRGELHLAGTVARPNIRGTVQITGGVVKLRGIDPEFTEVTGIVAFSADQATVERLTARAGDGTLALTGRVGITAFRLDRLDVRLEAAGARLAYRPYVTGIVDGTVRLEGTAQRPVVTGAVTLSNGDVNVGAGVAAPGGNGIPVSLTNPALNVDLRAGEGLWVNVGGLRFQVHGVLHAAGLWRRPLLSGEVTADQGTFRAFNTTFTLTEGRAAFAEFRGILPFVDAVAETRVGSTVITLHVTGTPDNLTLSLSSDPPLSRQQIVNLLASQTGITQLFAGDLEGALRAQLSQAIFGSVNLVIARALGLDEFTIVYDFVRPLQLRIGKLLIRNLYLTFASTFGIPPLHVASLEWRFTANRRLALSIDNFNQFSILYLLTYRW
ncbi:MAG TPA: translocation/assembly module TamB domain-containing protein [bacterium]|nr:translocation/assembly module TamB domain-containing protein [bacterium]